MFDQGIDPTHPDLNGNLLTALGRNASNLSAGGSPVLSTDNHGTAVAGTIAAERNGSGIVGVAYEANLVSIYDQMTVAEIPNALAYASNFDVLNNSWGFAPQGTSYYALYGNWAFTDNFLTAKYSAAGIALANLAATGRHGLGTVVVQSAGNSFSLGDDTNLHNFQNSQYIITVAATDYLGKVTSYSSPGASVLISAPGGGSSDWVSEIITTDRVGAAGFHPTDYTYIAGTSFSAPIVSGIVALMLDANPNLGYRDVQEILAYSARKIDPSNNIWSYNGASNWNGGGLHYDDLTHNLGYGLVDALAAIRMAETWTSSVHTAANRAQVTATHSVAKVIPDGGGINATASVSDAISVATAIGVERAEVTLNVTHPYVGDLSVWLFAPSGTASVFLWRPQQNALSSYGTNQDNIHFTFDTVLDWGESSVGSWRLAIYDNAYGDIGTFDSWTLNLIGKPVSADDTYIYTNEFAEATADQAARSILSDTGGTDTLNAAACTANLVLNLVPGGVSTIDGRSLTIAVGTVIENAYGGDGDDTITGNSTANVIYGMRGDDHIDGGDGNDTLYGGAGDDTFDWNVSNRGGSDVFYGGVGNDTFVLNSSLDSVIEYAVEGTDTVWVAFSYSLVDLPNVENLSAYGTTGISLTGNAANNTITGASGSDTIDGGAGTDTVSYTGVRSNYSIAWLTGGITITSVADGTDTLRNVEFARFSDQTMSLTPPISGGVGNDTLTGTTGADLLYGNGGDDRITGMGGGDSIYGGSGIDTVVFAHDSGDYLVSKNPTTGSYEVISKTGAIDYVDADVEKMAFRDITVDSASYKYYGTTDPVLAGSVSSVYRFFNTNDNAFFYTNSVTERDTVLSNSDVSHNNVGEWPYVYQGSSFEAAHTYAGAVSLERFYNTVTHHHFFTSSATEAATVKANSASGAWPFVYEGVSLYVYASDPTPNSVGQEIAVERFYSATLNRHWFTADQTEIAQIRLTGLWVDEGIGFWGEKPGA